MSALTSARAVGEHAEPNSSSESASRSQMSNILTRTLSVNLTDSLSHLSMKGPTAGTWKVVDGKGISVFGVGSEVDAQVFFFTWPAACLPCLF